MYNLLPNREIIKPVYSKDTCPAGKELHSAKFEPNISETILKIPSISKAISMRQPKMQSMGEIQKMSDCELLTLKPQVMNTALRHI